MIEMCCLKINFKKRYFFPNNFKFCAVKKILRYCSFKFILLFKYVLAFESQRSSCTECSKISKHSVHEWGLGV